MKKSTFILFALLLFFCTLLKSQTPQNPDTGTTIVKAIYQKEDIKKALWRNLIYPQEAFMNQIQGDVILSFVINANGKLDDISVVSTPSEILSLSSIVSLNEVSEGWNPSKVNGVSIDKTYLLVYRYRVFMNSAQPDYEKKAAKMLEKQKFEKALKFYNKAIDENKFDFKLFEGRAKTEELLGDLANAKNDREQMTHLKNVIISTIDVTVIGRSYTRSLGTQMVRSDQLPIN